MATPKIVLMTGSSAGIGLATAERLAKDPDKRFLVIATVISFAEKDDLVTAVGDALDKTIFLKELDVTKDEQITTVVRDVVEEYGRIDILLNIAGIAISGLVDTMSRDQIDLTFNINTIGVIRLTQAVLPIMKEQRAGKIICITSSLGKIGCSFLEVYSASKFAVEGFFESIAAVARKHNIWVSMVEPTVTKTGLARDILTRVERTIADEAVGEVDRRYARNWLETIKKEPILPVANVVAKIAEVVESEKPFLRHLVPGTLFGGPLGKSYSDFTGEELVAMNMAIVSDKEEQGWTVNYERSPYTTQYNTGT